MHPKLVKKKQYKTCKLKYRVRRTKIREEQPYLYYTFCIVVGIIESFCVAKTMYIEFMYIIYIHV